MALDCLDMTGVFIFRLSCTLVVFVPFLQSAVMSGIQSQQLSAKILTHFWGTKKENSQKIRLMKSGKDVFPLFFFSFSFFHTHIAS